MHNQFKDWAESRKDELDDRIPPTDLWDKIEAELSTEQKHYPRSIRWRKILQLAAVLFLIASAGMWIYQLGREQGHHDYVEINPELARTQEVYRQIIDSRKDSLSQLSGFDPKLSKEFSMSLREMEVSYSKLKAGLAKSPNPEKTLQAMILNLEVQANVLYHQLDVFQKIYRPQLMGPTHKL